MESSDDDDWLIPVLFATVLSAQGKQRLQSNGCTTGQEWVDDVLNCGNDKRIRNQLRMQLNTFSSLRDWLCINTTLHSSVGSLLKRSSLYSYGLQAQGYQIGQPKNGLTVVHL